MKQSAKSFKRVVVKIGSSLFSEDGVNLDFSDFNAAAAQIAQLQSSGSEVIVVSSGAVALGMDILGLSDRPKELSLLQVAAAVGQNEVINHYRGAFRGYGCHAAQVLLTWDDFSDRKRYLGAKNTLLALLRAGAVPIINENDAVAADEIKFGDNDRLSALVANLVNADLLIILSDVEGLLGNDKTTVIPLVDQINPAIRALACPSSKKTCVGGMISKLDAAKMVMDSGIPCVIANGRRPGIIKQIVQNPWACGTIFVPRQGHLASRARWIAFGSKPKGTITVDDGAKKALGSRKSLLAVGVKAVSGVFKPQDIVALVDLHGQEFARGRAGLSSVQLDAVRGTRFNREVIHCDDIVILQK